MRARPEAEPASKKTAKNLFKISVSSVHMLVFLAFGLVLLKVQLTLHYHRNNFPTMGCGASTGSVSEAMKLHSKIRWFSGDDSKDEKEVKINDILGMIKSMEVKDKTNGNVAIHIAAQNGHFEIVDLLISKGCQMSPKNRGGNTRELKRLFLYSCPLVLASLVFLVVDVFYR